MKYKGNTLIIEKSDILPCDMDAPPTMVDKILIAGDFDFDIDRGPHFCSHPNLKEFEVVSDDVPFFVYCGALYLKLNKETRSKDMSQAINGEDGSALVCCPPNNPNKNVVVHKDCSIIFGSAFYGCNLESLTFPSSIRRTAFAAFLNVKIKKIYIPNKIIDIYPDFAEVNDDVRFDNIEKGVPLDFEVLQYWKHNVTGQ